MNPSDPTPLTPVAPSTPQNATCTSQGRAHTWALHGRRGHVPGTLIFRCATCGAWGWAAPTTPRAVRGYANPFADPYRLDAPRPEPTVLTREQPKFDRDPALSWWVDRRGDLLPLKSGPTWYTPRYGLGDSERVPMGGRRRLASHE